PTQERRRGAAGAPRAGGYSRTRHDVNVNAYSATPSEVVLSVSSWRSISALLTSRYIRGTSTFTVETVSPATTSSPASSARSGAPSCRMLIVAASPYVGGWITRF